MSRANSVSGSTEAVSPLTLNRLSFYLRCLRQLQEEGNARISSQKLAQRFHLSATQIRKDLAQFGEFGIRGVGYDVAQLSARLHELLGLDQRHRLVIVGMGNLGSALARYLGFNSGSFQVVGGVDRDPKRIGKKIGSFVVRPSAQLAQVVRETEAHIGVLCLPAEAAQENYDALVAAGIRGVISFSPTRVKAVPEVPLKDVDLRVDLEELAYFLRHP